MEVEKLNNRILNYRIYDEDRHAVMYYILDCDKYSLYISGESHSTYKWYETPKTKSFEQLLLRCSPDYLMDKLYERSFDLPKSIESVKRYIEEEELFDKECEEEEKENCFREIELIDTNYKNEFIRQVCEILDRKDVLIGEGTQYELWEITQESYNYWDEKAVEWFCKYIKPELLKELDSYMNKNNLTKATRFEAYLKILS